MLSRKVSLLHNNTKHHTARISQLLLTFFLTKIEGVSGWKTSFQLRRGQADGGKVAEGVCERGLRRRHIKAGPSSTKMH